MPYNNHNENDTMSELSDTDAENTFSQYRTSAQNMFSMDPMSQRYIINAITGQRYHCQLTGEPIKQNSLPSKQLWSVMDCTAPNGAKDPVKLYYDTPEQYERHRHVKVQQSSKDTWRKTVSDLGYSPFGGSNVATVPKTEVTIIK